VRVISFNVNGIRAAQRKGFDAFLEHYQPDIVCLQEVKAHEDDIPALLDGYHACWHPAKRKGYSGVGILSKQEPECILKGMGIERYDAEGRVLRADFGKLTVLSVYMPSGSSASERQVFKIRFLKDFLKHIKTLLAERRELLICGDINIAHQKIDLTNWQQNQRLSGFLPEERAWLDKLFKLGLADGYRNHIGSEVASYSWWSLRTNARARNVGWRLDYQIGTPGLAERVTFASIPREPILSDHAPVIMDYQLE
jgi:exodeoxyribonuclease III